LVRVTGCVLPCQRHPPGGQPRPAGWGGGHSIRPRRDQDSAACRAHQEEGYTMSEQQAAILRPETLIEEFKKNGVTHIITIPDSETNYLYELMKEQPWLDVIPTAREGETFAIALGLQIGGKVPVVLIQNTGMMESGDSIRGMALDAGFPLVMVIGYR